MRSKSDQRDPFYNDELAVLWTTIKRPDNYAPTGIIHGTNCKCCHRIKDETSYYSSREEVKKRRERYVETTKKRLGL